MKIGLGHRHKALIGANIEFMNGRNAMLRMGTLYTAMLAKSELTQYFAVLQKCLKMSFRQNCC